MNRLIAGIISAGDIGYNGVTTDAGASQALTGAFNTAYVWAGIIAIISLIISGYFFITANGDASRIKRGKDGVFASVVGLVIVAMAFTITNFVVGRF